MVLDWKSKARTIVRRAGVDVHRYRVNESIDARRHLIMEQRQIDLLLDVGANAGQYARRVRASGYPGRIVSFEPLSEAFRQLSKAAQADAFWDCLNLALGRKTGEASIGVAGNSNSSSLLPMNPLHASAAPGSEYVQHETVRVERLDALSETLGIGAVSKRLFLKIDTQGFELEVLGGAEGLIPKVAAIEIELSLVELYAGQPLFREVIDYLDGLEFVMVGLEPGFSDMQSGHLLQMDGIFVRPENSKVEQSMRA